MSNQPMILVAEPEEAVRESIQITLIEEGYDCHAVCDTVSLLRAIRIHNSNLIIADVHIIYDRIQEILDTQNHYSTVPPLSGYPKLRAGWYHAKSDEIWNNRISD